MILYHGSSTFGIETLEPRLADHERPYIYMSTLEIVAGFYMVNAVERPYYWFPYGFGSDGKVEYDELYPDALREVSEGKSGCIYVVEADEKDVLPFKNIPCARLGTVPMKVKKCIEIQNCYEWFLEQEKLGKFRVRRYEDKSEKELLWWNSRILSYIDEKEMIRTPDCSYAKFVKKKFPKVWEDYEKLCAEKAFKEEKL
ncbi:MAG: hypothetical protein IJO01_02850 [Oscillospiraceae bacterium]|nr:hypothetical protein [Oscillospiraceae bacterium]